MAIALGDRAGAPGGSTDSTDLSNKEQDPPAQVHRWLPPGAFLWEDVALPDRNSSFPCEVNMVRWDKS